MPGYKWLFLTLGIAGDITGMAMMRKATTDLLTGAILGLPGSEEPGKHEEIAQPKFLFEL